MDATNTADRKFQKELNAGAAALVLLNVMSSAGSPMYGYQIAKHIEADWERVPMMKQGTLYPVLRSLEASGLLESRVDPSVSGPPRRYYSITQTGRQTLARWKGIWDETKSFVDAMLQGGPDDQKH